jgi:hypothetical protein
MDRLNLVRMDRGAAQKAQTEASLEVATEAVRIRQIEPRHLDRAESKARRSQHDSFACMTKKLGFQRNPEIG